MTALLCHHPSPNGPQMAESAADSTIWTKNGWRVLFIGTRDLVQRLQIARRERGRCSDVRKTGCTTAHPTGRFGIRLAALQDRDECDLRDSCQNQGQGRS